MWILAHRPPDNETNKVEEKGGGGPLVFEIPKKLEYRVRVEAWGRWFRHLFNHSLYCNRHRIKRRIVLQPIGAIEPSVKGR